MTASRVEYRIFSASPDPMGEERYPLALIHWDGRQLRFAMRARLPSALEREEKSLGRVLRALRRRADKVPPGLDLGLDTVFEVRGGDGGATAWGPIRVALARDPEAHFGEMVEDLRLHVRRAADPFFDKDDVSRALVSLGDDLSSAHDDRIRTSHPLRGFDSFTSPLSWLNGAWVHTLPFVVHGGSNAHEAVRRIASTLELAVPQSELLVVAYPEVRDRSVDDEFLRGIAFLAGHSSSSTKRPRIRSIALPWSDEILDTTALRALITEDIQSAA